MQEMLSFSWILPVSFLPGIAILILSTINKRNYIYVALSSSISLIGKIDSAVMDLQEKRLKIIHQVLTLLYLGVASFSLSSLVGGLTLSEMALGNGLIMVLLCSGILSVTIGASLLIYESHLATKSIIRESKLRQKAGQAQTPL